MVEMEISELKVLVGSISSFLNLSSSKHIDLDPFDKYYKRVEELLRVLKPISDVVVNSDLVLNEKLVKAFEELTQDVDQSSDLFRSWQAFSSKVYFVLQIESLLPKMRDTIVDIFQFLMSSKNHLPDELSPASLEQCLEKIKHLSYEEISSVIDGALRDQRDGVGPSPEILVKIGENTGLRSNQEILIEAVALERQKEMAEQSENNAEVEFLDQLIVIVNRMHERLLLIKQTQTSSVAILADFFCPLSLEEGQKIEPTWYMPIIPTVLVNGSEGIGTGWSTLIPNYNPREIVANIRRLLNGESMVPMHPWYRGFKGTIEKTASKEGGCTYTTTGLYKEVNDTTLRITELPIRKWTDDYIQFLISMKADNGVSFIKDVRAYNDDTSVDFDLILGEDNMKAARQEGFLEKFKLTTTIAISNMHLFDKNGVLKNYATPEEILEEFFDLRLEYYEKRKEIMLKNLYLELLKLDNKEMFIRRVSSGEIVVSNWKEADIVQELRRKGFTPFPKMAKPVEAAVAGATDGAEESEESSVAPAPSSPFIIPGSDYDYLLAMAIGSLTIEKFQELCAHRRQMTYAFEDLKKATPRSLWLRDLEAFEMELDKLDQQDAQAEEERKVAQEKIRAGAGVGVKGRKQAPKKPAPKKTTKKASESETTETSNSAMDTDNKVAEVVKPKGRQGAKKKAPAAKDDMLDLAQRPAQYNFGSAPGDSSKTTETSKAIAVDDDDDDVVVEVAPAKKGGRKPAASKAAKPPAAPRKRWK